MYDFTTFPDRKNSESVKWGLYEPDVLPMWVADMDFVSPQPVIDALLERVRHGVFGYPMIKKDMKQVIVERMARRYGWSIDPSAVVFVPGVVPGFNLVCQALAGPGDSIVMLTPVYPPFFSAPANAGAEKIEVPMMQSVQGRYEIDFEAFEAALQPNTKVFMLCNPHNPVGRVFSREELQRLGEICLRHGVTICSDEIHSDLVFSGHTHTPIASISEVFDDNSVTLIAPSKTFNIAGLECSVILCKNPDLRKKLETARKGLLGGVNVLGLTAGLAAYQHGEEWLKELLVVLEINRDLLTNFLQARLPEIKVTPAEATYLAWLDCRALNLPGGAFNFFLKEGRVALNEGKDFGAQGEGFLRFNFGCPTAMVQEALERMEKAVRGR